MLMRRVPIMSPTGRRSSSVDRIFDTVLSELAGGTASMLETAVFPPVNIWQDDTAVHVEAELPGFSEDQIEITMLENRLTLRGSRVTNAPEGAAFLRRERRTGQFSRTIELPIDVDAENVSAEFTSGVLHVTLPKSAAAQPRRIEVKARG